MFVFLSFVAAIKAILVILAIVGLLGTLANAVLVLGPMMNRQPGTPAWQALPPGLRKRYIRFIVLFIGSLFLYAMVELIVRICVEG